MKKFLILTVCLCASMLLLVGCADNSNKTQYSMEINYDNNTHILNVAMNVEYYNDTDTTLDKVCFNVPANAYRQYAVNAPIPIERQFSAYPNGVSYGYTKIQSISVNSGKCNYSLGGSDNTFLTVNCEPIEPNQVVTFAMKFDVQLANVKHRLGYCDDVVTLGNFYPILAVHENGKFVECPYYNIGDPFYSQVADYDVSLTCDDSLIVGASGSLIDCNEGKNDKTCHYKLNDARDFAMTLSNKFHTMTTDVDGVHISYLYCDDRNAEQSFNAIIDAFNTYNGLIGKYPYDTLTVSETPFIQGGMEYPAHVFISNTVYKNYRVEVIAHELAHQWWYAVVGNDEINFSLFDEGLATYSTVLFYENNPKYGYSRTRLIKEANDNLTQYREINKELNISHTSPLIKPLDDFNSEYEYVYTTYIEGQLFFDDLRNTIGDRKFFDFLQQLYKEYKYQNVDLEKFIDCLETSTSMDMKSWVTGRLCLN